MSSADLYRDSVTETGAASIVTTGSAHLTSKSGKREPTPLAPLSSPSSLQTQAWPALKKRRGSNSDSTLSGHGPLGKPPPFLSRSSLGTDGLVQDPGEDRQVTGHIPGPAWEPHSRARSDTALLLALPASLHPAHQKRVPGVARECASSTLPLVLDSLPPELSPLHGHGQGLAILQRGRAPELVTRESQRSRSGSPSRLASEPSSRQPGSRGFRALACGAVLRGALGTRCESGCPLLKAGLPSPRTGAVLPPHVWPHRQGRWNARAQRRRRPARAGPGPPCPRPHH